MARQLGRETDLEAPRDGRLRRSTVTRENIVQALLELVREGELAPTAEQVAARARVGIRTVFRHFDDMESLYAELSAHVQAEVRPLLEESIPRGSLEDRARALLRRRIAVYERIAPFRRSGEIHRWRSQFLQREQLTVARHLREDLLQTLPELTRSDPPLVEALELVTSPEAWDRLRVQQRLGRERAHAAIERTVLALLQS